MTHKSLPTSEIFSNTYYEKLGEQYASLIKQKEELIKSKIIEKGFGHLLEGIEKRKFPKLCCIKQEGWSLYFADDGTEQGAFILAIKEVFDSPTASDSKFSITSNIYWQDTLPLINKQ